VPVVVVVAAVGVVFGVLATPSDASTPIRVLGALLGIVGAEIAVGGVMLVFDLWWYRRSGYRDPFREPGHLSEGGSGPRSLVIFILPRDPTVGPAEIDCVLRTPSGAVRMFQNNEWRKYGRGGGAVTVDGVPGDYEARWYIKDRGKFVDITRDRFTVPPVPGSVDGPAPEQSVRPTTTDPLSGHGTAGS
jgi:hypothetical protein